MTTLPAGKCVYLLQHGGGVAAAAVFCSFKQTALCFFLKAFSLKELISALPLLPENDPFYSGPPYRVAKP